MAEGEITRDFREFMRMRGYDEQAHVHPLLRVPETAQFIDDVVSEVKKNGQDFTLSLSRDLINFYLAIVSDDPERPGNLRVSYVIARGLDTSGGVTVMEGRDYVHELGVQLRKRYGLSYLPPDVTDLYFNKLMAL